MQQDCQDTEEGRVKQWRLRSLEMWSFTFTFSEDIRPLIKGQTRRKISTLLNQLPLLRMQTFRDIATYWATPQEFNPQPVVVMRTILHALCNVIGLYQGRLCPRRHGALTAGAAEVGGVAAQSPGP